MSEDLLVGIDVGTTACKAAVVRAGDGVEVALSGAGCWRSPAAARPIRALVILPRDHET